MSNPAERRLGESVMRQLRSDGTVYDDAEMNDFINRFGNLTDANQVASLHSLLRPFFLRRVKSDVEKNIPPKVGVERCADA